MERYEIRIAGPIGKRRAVALGCVLEKGGRDTSVLVFEATDQAALYGLLSRCRDAGFALVAVNPRSSAPQPTTTGRENDHG